LKVILSKTRFWNFPTTGRRGCQTLPFRGRYRPNIPVPGLIFQIFTCFESFRLTWPVAVAPVPPPFRSASTMNRPTAPIRSQGKAADGTRKEIKFNPKGFSMRYHKPIFTKPGWERWVCSREPRSEGGIKCCGTDWLAPGGELQERLAHSPWCLPVGGDEEVGLVLLCLV